MRLEKRILIVDDDDAIRSLLMTVLKRRGFGVDTARNGVEARERLRSCRYAVMLLDLMMPMVSGYDVLNTLAAEDESARPIVVVLTAGTTPRSLPSTLVSGFIRKPFDVELLVDTVAGCLKAIAPQPQPDACPLAESEHCSNPHDEPN